MNTTTITSSAPNNSTPPVNASATQGDLALPASGQTRQSDMKTTIDQVAEFHRAFGVASRSHPYLNDGGVFQLRIDLLKEELNELEDAFWDDENTAVEILDALTDLQYVLDGTYLALGFAPVKDAAFAEVHRSNMSKLGADGRPILRPDGKILKGPNYTPPDLAQFVDTSRSDL